MPGEAPIAALADDADELDVLWRLAAKGAYAVPAHAGRTGASGDYVVHAATADGMQALAVVPAALFLRARCRGWLQADADGARYRLSAAGLKALRQARSGKSRRPAKARRGAAASPARKHPRTSTRATQERPLAWLRRRKDKAGRPLVAEPQFAAGERLAADFWHAQLMPRVTASWSAVATSRRTRRATPGVGVEVGDNVLAARQRVNRALTAVGPELAGILVDICCYDLGLEAAERALGLPQRSGKVVLQLALTSLARHYGLIAPVPAFPAHRLRHWGSADYRPGLDAWR